ncbi:MAG: hypothetical protein CSA50_01605 [Gammaproteobacteria bacterium]|nr:MAG: hypothetical protein CSA50_01605 [Gammaproteobacteria bacterium]
MNFRQLQTSLSRLKGWRETLFVLLLAQRAFPNFALFVEAVGEGNGHELHEIITRCWELLAADDRTREQTDVLVMRLEELAIDPNRYDVYGVYPAIHCYQLVEQVLYSWLNPDNRRALNASRSSLQTVTEFVEYTADANIDENDLVALFDHHPLVKQEQDFQIECFRQVKMKRFPSAKFIKKMRKFAENKGVSNIGICLD